MHFVKWIVCAFFALAFGVFESPVKRRWWLSEAHEWMAVKP